MFTISRDHKFIPYIVMNTGGKSMTTDQKTSSWGVYYKSSDQTYQFDGKSLLKDDISGGLNIEPKFVCNGLIYSWTDALSFKNRMSGDEFRKAEVKNPNRKSELEKLAASVKEDDNHLLIVITPKK